MNWERTAATDASAAPGAVWRTLLDGRRWSEWNAAAEWMVVEDGLVPGRHVTIKPKRSRQTAFTLEAAIPERLFAIRVTFGSLAALRLRWTLDPAGPGTRIGQTVAISGVAAAVLLKKRAEKIAAAMPHDLERLARRSTEKDAAHTDRVLS
ncbi:MAG: SRPBCC family protein [Candidatus Velthaea sp.]